MQMEKSHMQNEGKLHLQTSAGRMDAQHQLPACFRQVLLVLSDPNKAATTVYIPNPFLSWAFTLFVLQLAGQWAALVRICGNAFNLP